MKRLSLQIVFVTVVASLGAMPRGGATTISYELVGSLPSQTYRYTVVNDTLGVPIGDFAIFFPAESSPDALNYTLNAATVPVGWSATLVPASAIDLGAFGEAYVAGGVEIPVAGSLGGFEIDFTYGGVGTPGSQMFQIFDPVTFDLLETGYTTPASHGVPDTGSSLAYAMAAGALLAGFERREAWKRGGARK